VQIGSKRKKFWQAQNKENMILTDWGQSESKKGNSWEGRLKTGVEHIISLTNDHEFQGHEYSQEREEDFEHWPSWSFEQSWLIQ
jgi:hypothetical protein